MGKIVFVDRNLLSEKVGGAEVQLWTLAEAFAKSGWETYYVTDARVDQHSRKGVTIFSIDPGRNASQHYQNFRDRLNKIAPDVIYQRGRKNYTAFVGRYVRASGTPFIFAASMDVDCFRFKEVFRLKSSSGWLDFIRRLRWALAHDIDTSRGIRSATQVLTQSLLQQQNMLKHLGKSSVVIPNMHKSPDFGEVHKSSPPIVLWLANLKQGKRPELFFEMMDHLGEQDCRFIMAGAMAEPQRYAGLIKNYQMKYRNFEYRPKIDFQESNKLIGEASVFINTSLGQAEGFPNTFIQAWLRRTPTISLGVDPDNLIGQHKLGGVVTEPLELAGKVMQILRDRALADSMGARAEQLAKEKFGLEKNFHKVEQIAATLAAKHS